MKLCKQSRELIFISADQCDIKHQATIIIFLITMWVNALSISDTLPLAHDHVCPALVFFVLHQDFPTVLSSEHGAWLCFMGVLKRHLAGLWCISNGNTAILNYSFFSCCIKSIFFLKRWFKNRKNNWMNELVGWRIFVPFFFLVCIFFSKKSIKYSVFCPCKHVQYCFLFLCFS